MRCRLRKVPIRQNLNPTATRNVRPPAGAPVNATGYALIAVENRLLTVLPVAVPNVAALLGLKPMRSPSGSRAVVGSCEIVVFHAISFSLLNRL